MKLIDRCITCKHLEIIKGKVSSSYFCLNTTTRNTSGLYEIDMPQDFGCIFYEGETKHAESN